MTKQHGGLDRRALFGLAGTGMAGVLVSTHAAAATLPPSPVDTGSVVDGKVSFPAWRNAADTPAPPPPAPMPPSERVGFAIVGLGRLSTEQILPAFARSLKARPVALVSGSPDKMRLVAQQYGIAPAACYSYEDFDRIRDNPDIKAVYIVLPNAMHREFCERAARAGKQRADREADVDRRGRRTSHGGCVQGR